MEEPPRSSIFDNLSEEDRRNFLPDVADRLSSLNTDGLDLPTNIRGAQLVTYAQSLVGRDFRAIAQLGLFALEPYLTGAELRMWKTLGRLVALAYVPSIEDMGTYIVSAVRGNAGGHD